MVFWVIGVLLLIAIVLILRVLRKNAPKKAPDSWPSGQSTKFLMSCVCGAQFEDSSDKFCQDCGKQNISATKERQAWRLVAGSLKNLKLCSEQTQAPHDQTDFLVDVDVRTCGLNFADIFACQGLYSATPPGSFVPGLEFSGVITSLRGSKGHAFQVGDRVMGATRFGGFATRVIADVRCCYKLPEAWSFDQGGSFLCQALTAYYGLKELAHIKRGATVLVHSAAGGVGLFCLKIVEALGGVAIGTVGSHSKVDFLLQHTSLTKEQIIVRAGGGTVFAKQLDQALQVCGRAGVDIIMDSLMGPYFQPGYERLSPTGKVVVFGAGSMTSAGDSPNWFALGWRYLQRPTLDPMAMISDNKAVVGFNLIWLWDHLEELQQLAAELVELLQISESPPHVDRAFDFREAPSALRYLHSGQSVGKVVLTVAADHGEDCKKND